MRDIKQMKFHFVNIKFAGFVSSYYRTENADSAFVAKKSGAYLISAQFRSPSFISVLISYSGFLKRGFRDMLSESSCVGCYDNNAAGVFC